MRLQRRAAVFAAVVTAGGMAVAGPAQAAPAAENCVVNLSAGEKMTCFATFTEAISLATGGRINDAPANVRAAVTDSDFDSRLDALGAAKSDDPITTQAELVLSIDYDGTNRSGSSLVWSGAIACSSGGAYTAGGMPSGWNDRVSSFQAYAGCFVKHYEHVNFGGASTPYQTGSSNLGALSNEVTSEKWAP